MEDRKFFNWVALVAVAVVVGAFALGYVGSALSNPTSSAATPSGSSASVPTTVYLTISFDPVTGWPQYSPANFSVGTGVVSFVITDRDVPADWTGCPCAVSGTVGGTEQVNGTTYSQVPATNVAHTFSIPSQGINVYVPGYATVSFQLDFTTAGSLQWLCLAPCGSDVSSPYGTPPMGDPGFMAGTITVA